jgi:hypothetical protein
MKSVITVFTDDSKYGKVAVAHAQKLTQIFDADIHVISLHKKIDLRSVFSAAEEGNTLCFVMPVASAKKLTFFNTKNARKWIRQSRVPVLTVSDKLPEDKDYQQVILPLDIHCRDKELALWASYFPTYFQKNCAHIPRENLMVHIIYNQYKDELLRQKVENNIAFVTKMFHNLEVPYKLHAFKNVDNIQTFGLKFAQQTGNSMMLFLMTEHYSLIDLIFGPIEHEILGNAMQIPVLCLNAREDTFVLCN